MAGAESMTLSLNSPCPGGLDALVQDSMLSVDYKAKPECSSADQPESQESNLSTPPMKGSPMNKILKDGSKWKEEDLNKFGIHYHTKPSSPQSIFEKVQGHASLGKHSSFSDYFEHVKLLQQNFGEIFILNQSSFELLAVKKLMSDAHGAHRPAQLIKEQDLGASSLATCQENEEAADEDNDETAEPASVEMVSADKDAGTRSGDGVELEELELFLEEGDKEAISRSRIEEARAIGHKILDQIHSAQIAANRKRNDILDMIKFNESRLNITSAIQRVDDFLDSLRNVVENALCFEPELNENMFANLFQDFANVFCVKFKTCGVKRYLKLGQLTITSMNDLRYDMYTDVRPAPNKKTVVTVAEVKQNATRRDAHSPPPRKKLRSADACTCTPAGSQPITSDSAEDERDDGSPDCLEFPHSLRGQHGIELLADLEKSCLLPTEKKSMILGMTIEATFVRLTCLDIEHNKLKKIQDQEPQDAVKRIGTIYYTKAYDMLMKDDRDNLILIMRYLLLLSKNPSASKWLPRD